MVRRAILSVFALAALAGLAEAPAGEPASLQAKAARIARLQDRHAASLVQVKYYVKLGPEGESPDFLGWSDEVKGYLDRGFPVRHVGYVIAPDRVLLADPLLLPKWIDRIEVDDGGETVAATEAVRYPGEQALELKTARPLARVRLLSFASPGVPERPDFLGAALENGRLVTRLKGTMAFSRVRGTETRDVVTVARDAILVNASNEAVTVCLKKQWSGPRALEDLFRPPAAWKGVPAETLARDAAAVNAAFGRQVVGVYLRLETNMQAQKDRFTSMTFVSESESWSAAGKGDERDVPGFVLAGGDVFVPAMLTSEETARLQRIELVHPDGRRIELTFAGAFGDWGGFVARFPDGRIPDGLEPCRCGIAPGERHPGEAGWDVKFVNAAGRIKVDARPVLMENFRQVRGGEFVPHGDCEHGMSLLADREGGLVSLRLARRTNAERFSRGGELIGGRALAELLASRDFNPEFRPRVDTDRVRTAWIGADVIGLTDEVAREKKVTAFLSDSRSRGALVAKVYPDTPAAAAGIRDGDVLVDLRLATSRSKMPIEFEPRFDFAGLGFRMLSGDGTLDGTRGRSPWPNVESGVNEFFTRIGIGTRVVMSYVSGGVRREAEMTLAQVPEHFLSAPRSRNRDIGMTVGDLTFEVRDYYRLEKDAPGVVVMKLKPGDPAAVAGLRAFEIITEVNGEPVKDAKDFGRKIKGQKKLSFSVRRLTATRIVRIEL